MLFSLFYLKLEILQVDSRVLLTGTLYDVVCITGIYLTDGLDQF